LSRPIVDARDLRRHYQAGDTTLAALAGVSFTIGAGEFVSVMGPSGSGKSTLLNLLGCLDRPTSGVLAIAGHELAALEDGRLSRLRNRTIGFVFQSFHLLPQLSVLANVTLPLVYARVPAGLREARGREVLAAVGLAEKAGLRPTQLSGGQCQRVAIARALVNRPSLILADEPTGNLDSRTGMEVMHLLSRIHGAGATLVMVTHDRSLAELTQRILTLVDGRLVSDEAPSGRGGEAATHGGAGGAAADAAPLLDPGLPAPRGARVDP
jgi:putative ABC transport system ATP-binding protein